MRVLTCGDPKEAIFNNTTKDTGCWLLPKSRPGVYRIVKYNGKGMPAHRYSYMVHNGPLIPGMVIMHTCDNPPCINPEHLKQGTQDENIQDAINKGRWKHGRLWSKKPPKTFLKYDPNDRLKHISRIGQRTAFRVGIDGPLLMEYKRICESKNICPVKQVEITIRNYVDKCLLIEKRQAKKKK